jgi:plastocyanin
MTNTPDPILVSVGAGVSYPKLDLVPLPAASTGSEAVTLNSTAPAGLTLKFNPSTVTLSTANKVSVALVVNSTQSLAPGDYKISVVAHYGSTSTKSDITIRVVQYLVFQTTNSFSPSSITVKSGTTVYWINLDSPVGGDPEVHNVVFSSGSTASSSSMNQFDSYSYTFTAPGAYAYMCTFHPGMKGTVTVTA